MEAKTEAYHIYFDKEEQIVVMEWRGYATSVQFKEGTELMLDLLWKHRCNKVFADIEEMVMIGMEDQKWLEEDFLPRAIQYGFKALAIIKPQHYFNKVAVESVSYKVDQDKLKINFFNNRKEARRWLSSV